MADELELETILKCDDALKLGLAARHSGGRRDSVSPQRTEVRAGISTRAFPALTGDMPFEVQVAKERAGEARALIAPLITQ